MNKRSFIKSLLIGCVAPSVFLPKESINWKRINNLFVPNPAWKDAPLEYYFIVANEEAFNLINTGPYPKLREKNRLEFVSENFVSFKDMFLAS